MLKLQNFTNSDEIDRILDYYRRRKLVFIMERLVIREKNKEKELKQVQKKISRINVKILVLEAYNKYRFGYN